MLIVDNCMIRGLPLAAFYLHFWLFGFHFMGFFICLFVCLLVFFRYLVIVLAVLHTSVCCRAGGMDFSEGLC